jgi:hypothetical protein
MTTSKTSKLEISSSRQGKKASVLEHVEYMLHFLSIALLPACINLNTYCLPFLTIPWSLLAYGFVSG